MTPKSLNTNAETNPTADRDIKTVIINMLQGCEICDQGCMWSSMWSRMWSKTKTLRKEMEDIKNWISRDEKNIWNGILLNEINSKLNTEEGNNESEDRATWNIKKELYILYLI